MKTWNDYKEHIKSVDPEIAKDINEVEDISAIITISTSRFTAQCNYFKINYIK